MNEMKKTLGIRLRNRRQELKLTQDEVASRAGFSSKYVSEIERGCRDMPLSTLCRIVEQGLEWRVDEAVFGLTSQTEINANEAPVSPLVQQLALELSSLPDDKQRELVQLLSGIAQLATHSRTPPARLSASG